MQKDPQHTEQTPYELLGLPLDAPLPEMREALKNFLRAKGRTSPHLLGPAQQAHKRLQNALGRAEVDIWFYDLNLPRGENKQASAIDLDEFSCPRTVPLRQLYCVLSVDPADIPQREIKPRQLKFSDVRTMDDVDTLHFEPEFDR